MKSDPALVATFTAATEPLPGIERRQMFGYPAVFTNGNMVAGLFEQTIVLRLDEGDCESLIERGLAMPFVAMGQTMRGWVAASPALLAGRAELDTWLGRALAHAGRLPAKPVKRPRRSGS